MQPEHDSDVRVEYRGTGFYVSLAIIFLAAVTLLILAVQNTGEVTIEVLAFEFDLPLFAVILGTALIVVIIDELIGVVWRRQRRTRLEERAELQRLRAEQKARDGSATEVEDVDEAAFDEPDEKPTPDLFPARDTPHPTQTEGDNSPT